MDEYGKEQTFIIFVVGFLFLFGYFWNIELLDPYRKLMLIFCVLCLAIGGLSLFTKKS